MSKHKFINLAALLTKEGNKTINPLVITLLLDKAKPDFN